MNGKKNIKILSYGCSTGEEVFSLREYFPDAFIVGVDINKRNIKNAISKNEDHKIIFSYDIEKTLAENGFFDIIFALAVLQRTENRDEKTLRSTHIYPFEKFNAKLLELDKCLKLNGIFVIDYSDYRFEDSDISVKYKAIRGDHNGVATRNLYSKNNEKILDLPHYNRIFNKVDNY